MAQLVTHHLLLVCVASPLILLASNMFHVDVAGFIYDQNAVFMTNIKHDCSKAEIKWVPTEMGCDGIHYIKGALT